MAPAKNGSASLRKRRLAAKISLRVMAKRVGISPTYLSMVERGLTKPTAKRVLRIEGVLEKASGNHQRRL